MATWAEFEAAEPVMAALGRGLLARHQLAYLATVRADGSPRLHPVCPLIADGRLFIATHNESPKRYDLLSGRMYALHMLPGPQDAEFWMRGHARRLTDAATRDLVLDTALNTLMPDGAALQITPDEWLFEYDVEEAGTAAWANIGTPDIEASRRFWRTKGR